jgi:hypothetical protein
MRPQQPANQSSNWAGLPLLALLFLVCVPLVPAQAEPWRFPDVDRVVALSDIHGAYDALVATLQEAGIIDDGLAWAGGPTHLVITGDLVDRGADSRRVMDLVMRLESEAPGAGGRVHLTLGNHEVMNIIGDLRYVADGEFAAFAEDESAEEREKWYQHFRRRQPADVDEATARSAFNEKAPPGYFGHRAGFRPDGVYGKWLLDKPLLVVVDDTAFVHGGLPSYVAEQGFEGVNITLKADLLGYLAARDKLESAGILSPIDGFKELPSILAPIVDAGQLDEPLLKAARVALKHKDSPLHTAAGPLWYRGSSVCSVLTEGDGLNAALQRVRATRVAIGHTTTKTRHIQERIGGRVLEINTGILESVYEGSGYALTIEDGALSIASEHGVTGLLPLAPPRRVGYTSDSIDDDALESILANGQIIESSPGGIAWRVVKIAAGDETVLASFSPISPEDGFVPELAAYRLDRMLGLDMVPVTVRRDVSGQRGTLQLLPVKTVSEQDRLAGAEWNRPTCSLEKQWHAMKVFDALMLNRARTPLTMLYYPWDGQLALVSHGNSFGNGRGRPPYLQGYKLTIGDEWRSALLRLDDDALLDNLGDVLDKRRLKALAKRRDALLADQAR